MPVPETEVIVSVEGAEVARHTVRPGDYVLGRAPDADLRVEAELVSRRHARLIVNYDHALIEDLGSSNGTFVNGQPITESTRLWPGQKIQVGTATVELRRRKAEADPEVTLPPAEAALQRLLPPNLLAENKYEIGGLVAQGGMGAILDAREAALRRTVAMKVMHEVRGADDVARFVEEAQVTGQLEHPNIVPVHELGVDENGQPFYTMKMVRGISLKKVLDLLAAGVAETHEKYPLSARLTIFQKVCDGIAFAHSKRVIHRDLKPENIMLGEYGEALVMDWGLAKVMGSRKSEVGSRNDEVLRSAVMSVRAEQGASGSTQAGTIMGTPQYMSPEQANGEVESLDERTDVYALGAILYQMLALRPPVTGATVEEVLEKVRRGDIAPVDRVVPNAMAKDHAAKPPIAGIASGTTRSTIPDSLAAVVRKAVALRKEDRYPSVPALQADVAAYQAGFATSAENASLFRQAWLLVQRHRAVFATAFAAWAIITALAVWFVVNLRNERNRVAQEKIRAEAGERRAEEALGVAQANLLRVKIQKAREAFDDGRGAEGLAWLAAVLRQDPENRFAPAWLLSALTDRNFPIPAGPRITIPATRKNPGSEQTSAVRFSPDGQRLLIGSRIGGLTVWNPFTGQPVGSPLSTADLKDAHWLPDGRRVVAMQHGSKEASLYDVTNGKLLAKTAASAHREYLSALAVSPDGSLLATGDGRGGVGVWKTDTLASVAAFQPLPGEIKVLEFSPDNRWLAIRTDNPRAAVVWDLREGKAATEQFPNIYGALAFHPTAPRLIFPGFTNINRWRMLDLASGEAVTAQESHGGPNIEAAFSPEGSRIASGAGEGRARVWDARTGVPLTAWMRHGANVVGPPQFSLAGLRLFTFSSDMLCRLWDVRSGELLAEPWGMPEGTLEPGRCRLSPDGAHAVLTSRRRTAQVWDIREGRQLPLTLKDKGTLYSTALSPDGRLLATGKSSSDGSTARLWDAATGEPVTPPLPHAGSVQSVAFSPDGARVLTASDDKTAVVWDAKTGAKILGPLAHENGVKAARFSPDGRRIATACWDKTVRIWDGATGAAIGAPIPLPHTGIQRLVWSADGTRLAVAIDYSSSLLCDAQSGAVLATPVRETACFDASFSADSRLLAFATDNAGVLVLDAATGQEALAPLPHPNRVRAVRFRPDGAALLSAGVDGTARVWDTKTGAPLVAPLRQPQQMNAAEWSPDGTRIATAANNVVRLWDARTGQPLTETMTHGAEVKALHFTPDGRRLAAMHGDRVAIWDVPPPPGPAPAWLPALAEAVAGRRIDEHGELAHTGTSDFWPIRDRLLARAGSGDYYERWAAWFLADRARRTATPWTETKLSEAVQARVTMGSDGDRELGLRYDTPARLEAMTLFGRSLRERENPGPTDRSNGEYLLALAPLQTLRNELARLRAAGHPAYTRDAGWRGFPARSGEATAREIDLTAHFNMTLDSSISGSGDKGFLSPIAKGLTTLDGVRWDVRGVVALASKTVVTARPYPTKTGPITIGQRAARLHFLHACTWGPPADGTRVGTYVLRYADGETRELPIVYGEDLRDWSFNADRSATAKHAREAWRGDGQSSSVRLFHRAYEDPRPEVEISSLDFVSAESDAGPFVVALTVE
jgi:WD40 repeat protein/serine/threonine protein kinase